MDTTGGSGIHLTPYLTLPSPTSLGRCGKDWEGVEKTGKEGMPQAGVVLCLPLPPRPQRSKLRDCFWFLTPLEVTGLQMS